MNKSCLVLNLKVFLVLTCDVQPLPSLPLTMHAGSTAECNGHSSSTNVYATPSPTQMESPHPIETNIVAEHYEFSQDVVSPSIEHQYELEPAEPAYQDPEYAQPTVSRIATLSQPYEVPLSALSTLAVRMVYYFTIQLVHAF